MEVLMRTYRVHNGQFAIDVKDPVNASTQNAIDRLQLRKGYAKDVDEIFEAIEEYCAWWTQYELAQLQNTLRAKYPTFNLRVEQTGRSGGWIELTGNWGSVCELSDETTHRKAIINKYIVPFFERRINELLDAWNMIYECKCNETWMLSCCPMT